MVRTCKIPTMKIYSFLYSLSFYSFLIASEVNVEDILIKAFHRLDNTNYNFTLDIEYVDKKKENKQFEFNVYWPKEGNVIRQVRVNSINLKRKKPSSYWEYRFNDNSKVKRWMSLPITGKLKDISDKNFSQDFSLSDLEISIEEIKLNENVFQGSEIIKGNTVNIIESIKKHSDGSIIDRKKIWINSHNDLIVKVEYYTKSGRLHKVIECLNVNTIDSIDLPTLITLDNKKSKSKLLIKILDIKINPNYNFDIFKPLDQ